jgi:cytochrome P450
LLRLRSLGLRGKSAAMNEPMPNMVDLIGGNMMSPIEDPYRVYGRLRRESPVLAVNTMLGINYLVTRYDDVAFLLRNAEIFSSRGNARGIGMVMGRTLLEMDGVEHVRHRNLISPFFSPLAMRSTMPPVVEEVVNELIDEWQGEGRVDLVSRFTFIFPMRVIANIIGVPIDDHAAFHRMALDLISIADDPARGLEASQELVAFLTPLLAERRAAPQEDLLSKLLCAEVDGHRLSDEEVLSFLRLLLPAGADTTYRLTGNVLWVLLHDADLLQRVASDRSLLEKVIQEVLRWESPVQLVSRETTRDTELAGTKIPAETIVSAILGSANRDPEKFPDPDVFDLDRDNEDHVGFGFGRHYCAGSHLARLETRTAVNAVLDRLKNVRLDGDQPSRIVGVAFRSPDRLPVRFD